MAQGYKEVSRTRPCPICGKTDYCCFTQAKDGGDLVVCKRIKEKENVIGHDANFYVFAGVSGNGNYVFEEANQRRAKEQARKGSYKAQDFHAAKVPVVKQLTVVDQVNARSDKDMDIIYRTLLSLLYLEPEDRKYLLLEGWTDELIEKNHIVSFPEKDFTRFKYRKDKPSKNPYRKRLTKLVMEKLGIDNLRGVPGAYKDSNGNWTFAGPSGILFPQYDARHYMYRLRIRMDFRDQDAVIHLCDGEDDWFSYGKIPKIYICYGGLYILKTTSEGIKKDFLKEISKKEDGREITKKVSGKYRNFASYSVNEKEEEKGFLVNTYDSGCESGNQLGFYYNEQRDDMYILYLTEGEKKSIFSNEMLRSPFVSTPGVNSWALLFEGKIGERPIDVMKAKGVKIFVVAYDADKAINKNVLDAEKQVVEAMRNEGLILGLAEWNMNNGKGIDDLLYKGYKPSYVLV